MRYGKYSKESDDIYEHPNLWGSKRTSTPINGMLSTWKIHAMLCLVLLCPLILGYFIKHSREMTLL